MAFLLKDERDSGRAASPRGGIRKGRYVIEIAAADMSIGLKSVHPALDRRFSVIHTLDYYSNPLLQRTLSTMKRITQAILLYCGLLACCPLWAQISPYTPPSGVPERKAILDALRSSVEKDLKRTVVFKVDHLKVQNGWAFVRGTPTQPGGSPLNYNGTLYEEAIKEGMFDDGISALLQKRRARWRTVTYVIGATDVPYEDWSEKYHAPPAIFK